MCVCVGVGWRLLWHCLYVNLLALDGGPEWQSGRTRSENCLPDTQTLKLGFYPEYKNIPPKSSLRINTYLRYTCCSHTLPLDYVIKTAASTRL